MLGKKINCVIQNEGASRCARETRYCRAADIYACPAACDQTRGLAYLSDLSEDEDQSQKTPCKEYISSRGQIETVCLQYRIKKITEWCKEIQLVVPHDSNITKSSKSAGKLAPRKYTMCGFGRRRCHTHARIVL